MSDYFAGQAALITQVKSGIHLAEATDFKQHDVKICGSDINRGEIVAFVTFTDCNIEDISSVTTTFEEFNKLSGQFNISISNSEIGSLTTVEKENSGVWRKVLNVNVVGTARVSKLAIPLLRKSKFASIVNTASVAAIDGIPNRAAYIASKGAVLTLTLAMATDHLVDGIRVNAVNPATTDTPWVKNLLDLSPDANAAKIALEARQPMGRLVSATEIANAIIFLASPLQASIIGTTLNVNGGLHSLRIAKS